MPNVEPRSNAPAPTPAVPAFSGSSSAVPRLGTLPVPARVEQREAFARGVSVDSNSSMGSSVGGGGDDGDSDDIAGSKGSTSAWNILNSISTRVAGLGAFQRRYDGPAAPAQLATRYKGKIVPSQKVIQLGSRGAAFYFSASGKRVYLKKRQLEQCVSGALPGDHMGRVCGHIDTSATRPTQHRARYGKISVLSG